MKEELSKNNENNMENLRLLEEKILSLERGKES